MFSNITWGDYAILIGITLCVYYALLTYVFYKNKVTNLFTKVYNKGRVVEESFSHNDMISHLEYEIKNIITEAKTKKYSKEELVLSIQLLFRKYNSDLLFPHHFSLTNYIVNELDNICSIHLNEDDLNRLWDRKVIES